MIQVDRGVEPNTLGAIRTQNLQRLRGLGRSPEGSEITGYRVVAEDLWRAQAYKCCYCEQKIKKGFNDVEHYRPKGRANRLPGSMESHGYWWLAYTWSNLLYACPSCNRSGKNDSFPLAQGCSVLLPEDEPPGLELPLLIDPSGPHNPVEHVMFVPERLGMGGPTSWCARPRNGSLLAAMTIEVVGLNSQELLELRTDYVESVIRRFVDDLQSALATTEVEQVRRAHERALWLLKRSNQYVGLAYDALRSMVPDERLLEAAGVQWPGLDGVPT